MLAHAVCDISTQVRGRKDIKNKSSSVFLGSYGRDGSSVGNLSVSISMSKLVEDILG